MFGGGGEMNIREKIQQARLEIQGLNLKKSGRNAFAGFEYYELKDFLPEVNKVFHALKLYDSFSITDCEACLKVFDLESENEVEAFSININEVRAHLFNLSAKGNALQNIGCMNTYLKRYLYLNMLNLVEGDEVDTAAERVSVSRDRNTKQIRLEKPVKTGDKVFANNPKVESYISKAESIHSPDEMNSFIDSLKDEKLASTEKRAIWNPIAETAKLQGWQLVNGAYV
ncbi:MAG: ERF family protein [Holosporales bacterium]|jgi:hypothetical protein|nr:ERF family protein [Holosporales bacterium]